MSAQTLNTVWKSSLRNILLLLNTSIGQCGLLANTSQRVLFASWLRIEANVLALMVWRVRHGWNSLSVMDSHAIFVVIVSWSASHALLLAFFAAQSGQICILVATTLILWRWVRLKTLLLLGLLLFRALWAQMACWRFSLIQVYWRVNHIYVVFTAVFSRMRAHFLLLWRRQQCLLFKQLLQFFSGNDRSGTVCITITSVKFCLSSEWIVDVASTAHAVLTCVLAPYLSL